MPHAAASALQSDSLRTLPLLSRGKVRDVYAVSAERLLIVTSDRLSAFDVILEDQIAGKGAVLTQMTALWLQRLGGEIANHATGEDPASVVAPEERAAIAGRSMLVKRCKPLPIEAVVRGYLIGSGWKDYCASGSVCGIALPPGLRLAEKLPEPLFTPSTKAPSGAHDENISFAQCCTQLGKALAEQVRSTALTLYRRAATFAAERGILIADTKFEFGLDPAGNLLLIDEVLTPDSSRFWPADAWHPGSNPPSFDKQIVRDWLENWRDASGQSWNKTPPAPRLPAEILTRTAERYQEILQRLS